MGLGTVEFLSAVHGEFEAFAENGKGFERDLIELRRNFVIHESVAQV
jgi:hypothetical protein